MFISNYIKKLLPDSPCIEITWHDYYISSKRKKQKGCLCFQWNWSAFYQSNYQQKHVFSHIIQKAVDNNLSEERTKCLTCDKSNYLVKFSTPHCNPCMTNPTPAWPTPPYPCMTHPPLQDYPTPAWPTPCMIHSTPAWPTPAHPCMIHPTPAWPTLSLHDPPHPCMIHPTPAWPTPPHWGTPFR